jgi:glycosyltransferase involved in cell wall biosynthesis
MRVLFLTTGYPTEREPLLATFVHEHASAAAQHCEVAVVHLARGYPPGLVDVHAGEPFPVWRVGYPQRPRGLSASAHLAAAAIGLRHARRDGFDADVIHAQFFLAGLPALLLSRKPVVVTEHWTALLPEDPVRLSWPLRLAAKSTFEHARAVLPVSIALGDAIAELAPRARLEVIPNAVDESLFFPGEPRNGAVQMLTVGVLARQKAVDLLLHGFAELRRDRPNMSLDVVGDGPERAALERLAADLELDSSVTFHGAELKPAVASRMRNADLFVLASRFENNPCVLLEAQCSGLPIVATDVGGVREIIGDNGVLATAESVESLAGALAVAIDRLPTFDRREIAEQGRRRYGREAIGTALAALYERCSSTR